MMQVVLLAGGMGTRLQEETSTRPKPMVEIGGQPILWHIMKHYAHYGLLDFHVALGYMGNFIKGFFLDCHNMSGNLAIDFHTGDVVRETPETDNWRINLTDTGLHTQTGGRLKRLHPWLKNEAFMLTYGDGVSNIDLHALLDHHHRSGCIATISAVRPPARFGGLLLNDGRVERFTEKPITGEGWINGGFMVLEPEVFNYLSGDESSLESDALERIAADGKLAAYRHPGFWQCMDNLRDKNYLQNLWETDRAPWKTWEPRLSIVPSTDSSSSPVTLRRAA